MLKLIDSGCAQHPPRHFTLTGLAAALVGRLTLNLPPTGRSHLYLRARPHSLPHAAAARGEHDHKLAGVWTGGRQGLI